MSSTSIRLWTGMAGLLCATAGFLTVPGSRAGERLFDTSVLADVGSYPEAFYPWAGKAVDMNGDGAVDYVASNGFSSARVSLLLSDGSGGFLSPSLHATDLGSAGVEVADFSGDGLPDVVASNTGQNNQGTTVALFRNLGGGSLAPRQSFAAATGPVGLSAADFDGDGRVDLAVAGYGYLGQGTQVAVLRNNGAGGFFAPSLLTVGLGPYDVRAADLSGDGRPDLIVARDNFRLVVLMNIGGGTFGPPVEYVTQEVAWAGNFYPNVEVGDVDVDGDLDVLCSSTRTQIDSDFGAVCLFKNQGNGTLGSRSYITLPRYLGGAIDIVAADVTGDGRLDLVTAHGDNGGWVMTRGLGAGSFGAGIEYAGGNDPMNVATADVDGDGDVDALVLNQHSLTLGVHLNRGDGTFLEPGGRDLEPLCSYMDAGDIDNDGDLDVVSSYAYAGGGGLSVVKNNGNGTFAPRQNYVGPRGAMTPRLDDLDGDGDLDLVWAFDHTSPPYDFAVRLNGGSGSFGPATVWPVGTCGTGELITMDVDQDGDRDVLLTDYLGCTSIDSPWVWIRRNLGNATFDAPYVIAYATSPKEMAAADFDQDGKEDLATIHADGLKVVRALGGGLFGPPQEYGLSDPSHEIVACDLNGDGYPDVATANLQGPWEGFISTLINRGDGTLGEGSTIRSAFSSDVSAIGELQAEDADLDGDLDLLMLSYGGQDLLTYENDGNAGFALQSRYVVGAAPSAFRCSDFDGDHRPDLAVVIGLPPSNLPRRLVLAPGLQSTVVDVPIEGALHPTGLALSVSGPNPFNDFTRLSFSLAKRGPVQLAVYDVAGREVARLLDGELTEGERSVTWDGRTGTGTRAGSGVYFARLATPSGVSNARLLLVR